MKFKRTLALLIVLILAANLTYYFIFIRDYRNDYAKCMDHYSDEYDEDYLKTMSCFDIAVRNNNRNLELCNEVIGVQNRTNCKLIVSEKIGNPWFCVDYKAEEPYMESLDLCIIHAAIINKDNSYCMYVAGYNYAPCMAMASRDSNYCKNAMDKDSCYLNSAIVVFDDTICDNIKNRDMIMLCEAITLKDKDKCSWLEGEQKVLCETVLTKDLKRCLGIELESDCHELIEIQKISARLN
jgi:hypothetical protein